jgi:hypothetical protein
MHFMTANKKNLAFLQRPAKVGELFGLGTRGARLGEEVPLDSIGIITKKQAKANAGAE